MSNTVEHCHSSFSRGAYSVDAYLAATPGTSAKTNPLTTVISAVMTGKKVFVKYYSTFHPLLIDSIADEVGVIWNYG